MKIKIVLFLSLLIFSSSNLLAKKYGLILGSNYKGNKAGISELNLCEADATYMNDQIKKVGNFDEVKVLLGPQITKNNIEKEIKAIGSKAKADVMVFFSVTQRLRTVCATTSYAMIDRIYPMMSSMNI